MIFISLSWLRKKRNGYVIVGENILHLRQSLIWIMNACGKKESYIYCSDERGRVFVKLKERGNGWDGWECVGCAYWVLEEFENQDLASSMWCLPELHNFPCQNHHSKWVSTYREGEENENGFGNLYIDCNSMLLHSWFQYEAEMD